MYSARWHERISSIPQQQWDTLALPLKTPLLEWQWLRLLEDSGSLGPDKGWLPLHLCIYRDRRLVGAAPLYIKGHSAGEFVFDHAWANLAERLGIRYYPKMVGMSPFSPIIGYRFLIDPGEDERAMTALMVEQIDRFCTRNRIGGCSFLFVDPLWGRIVSDLGFIGWLHQSYAWHNRGFETFDDYLAVFNTNQRRNIKKERRSMNRAGIRMRALYADQIPDRLFGLMYRYYSNTNDRYGPWGCKYLSPRFFEGLKSNYRHRLLITAAYKNSDDHHPVGMSFLLTKGDQLYGRYWGSQEFINHLHFNVCYYDPIQWAIARKIKRFDPGAGSSHKIRRGFEAVANHSLHRFYDERMQQLMLTHIAEINRLEQNQIDVLNAGLPFVEDRRDLPIQSADQN
jgi:predicted N-acyltransferase